MRCDAAVMSTAVRDLGTDTEAAPSGRKKDVRKEGKVEAKERKSRAVERQMNLASKASPGRRARALRTLSHVPSFCDAQNQRQRDVEVGFWARDARCTEGKWSTAEEAKSEKQNKRPPDLQRWRRSSSISTPILNCRQPSKDYVQP